MLGTHSKSKVTNTIHPLVYYCMFLLWSCYCLQHHIIVMMYLILDKKPKKDHLQCVLGPIEYKWKEIGEALKIPFGTIQSIDYDRGYNDTCKLSKVLQTWIDTQPSDVTWRNLIDVIREHPVKEPVRAKAIMDFLENSKISERYTECASKSLVKKICQG